MSNSIFFHVPNSIQPYRRGLIERRISPKFQDELILDIAERHHSSSPQIFKSIQSSKSYQDAVDALHDAGIPQSDLPNNPTLPSLEWLGFGYMPFGEIPDENSSRSQLFDIPMRYRDVYWTKQGEKKSIYENFLFKESGRGNFSKTAVLNMGSLSNSIEALVTGGGSFLGLFGGEFKVAFQTEYQKHWEYLFSRISLEYDDYTLEMPEVDAIKGWLRQSTRQDLEEAYSSKSRFHNFLETYGTHFIHGIIVGGRAKIYTAYEKESYSSKKDMSLDLEAQCKAFEGGTSVDISQAFENTSGRQNVSILTRGGKTVPTNVGDLNRQNWQKEVSDYPTWCGFPQGGGAGSTGLSEIYYLADNNQQNRLKRWWEEYLRENSWLPEYGMCLKDINVKGHANSASKGKNLARAGGRFSLVPHNRNALDLNKGAGGWYIYLGKQIEYLYSNEFQKAITDITAIRGRNAVAPPDYIKISLDLNKGCGDGSAYIYLWSLLQKYIFKIYPHSNR